MAEDTSILSVSVMEKLLDARFSKLEETLLARIDKMEARLDKQDAQVEEVNKQLSRQMTEGNTKLIKLVTTRFAEVTDSMHQQKAGGFFGKARGVSPSPASTTPASAVGGSQAEQSKLALLDNKMDTVLKRIDGQEAIVKKIEGMVNWTKGKVEQGFQGNGKAPLAVSSGQPGSTGNDESVKVLIEEKFSKLNDLTPKISQLHTNLDMLLTGESEANAIIDKLLPTVSKLQEEVSSLGKRFDAEIKELKEEHFHKIKDRLDDCTEDVKEVAELVDACKSYVKENLEVSEEIREKVKKQQYHPQSRRGGGQRYSDGGMPQYKYSSDEDNDDGNDKPGSRDKSSDRTVVKLDSDMKSQMITVHEKLDQIKNEIRRANVTDMIEERVCLNVYKIRKDVEEMPRRLAHLEMLIVGGPPPHHMRGGGPRGRRPYRGNPYQNRYDDRQLHHRYNYRGGRHNYKFDKWTYDEDGKCEQKSDEERRSRSRSRGSRSRSQSRSRSRSRSSHRSSRSHSHEHEKRRHKAHSESKRGERCEDLDVDLEMQIMSSKISKLSDAVGKMREMLDDWLEKMDDWRDYSKKALDKSNTNVELLADRIESHIKDLGETIDVQVGNGGGSHSSVLIEQIEKKLCEFGSLVEEESSKQTAGLQTLAQEMQQNIKNMKSLKKAVETYGQTGLQIAQLDKGIEGIVKDIQEHGHERVAELLRPRLDQIIKLEVKNEGGSPKKNADPRVASSPASPLSESPHFLQIFNRLNDVTNTAKSMDQEVKNLINAKHMEMKSLIQTKDQELKTLLQSKDQNLANSLGQVKGKLGEMKGDVTKCISYSRKINGSIDEVKKSLNSQLEEISATASADSKILSQVNSSLPDLEEGAQSSGKALSEIGQLAEAIEMNKVYLEAIRKSLVDCGKPTEKLKDGKLNRDVLAELKSVKESIEQTNTAVDQNRAFVEAIRDSQAKSEEDSRKLMEVVESNNSRSSSLAKILGALEIKLLNRLATVSADLRQISDGKEPLIAQAPPPRGRRGRGAAASQPSISKVVSLKEGGYTDNEVLTKLEVESLKILSAINELSPKVNKIEDAVTTKLPQEIGKFNVESLEQVLLNTVDHQDKQFETLEARLAVIRKYAKHNSASEEMIRMMKEMKSNLMEQQPGSQTQTCPVNVDGKQISKMLSTELRSLPMPTVEDLNRVESAVTALADKTDDILNRGNSWFEDQFECTADTVISYLRENINMDKHCQEVKKGVSEVVGKALKEGLCSEKVLATESEGAVGLIHLEKLQRECLQEVQDVKKVCGQKDAIFGEIKTLMELIHRVQALQAEDADNSIKFRTKFDQDMSHLLDALNSLNDLVRDRAGEDLDVSELPQLCEDVNDVIKALSEITVGKPACEDLPALVQQCVQYLQGLLKEDGAMVVEEEEEEEDATGVHSPNASIDVLTQGETIVAHVFSEDNTGEAMNLEEVPTATTSSKKRKRPTSSKTAIHSMPGAAEVSGPRREKRERVNYAESEEEVDEEQQQQNTEQEEDLFREDDDADSFTDETADMLKKMRSARVRLDKVQTDAMVKTRKGDDKKQQQQQNPASSSATTPQSLATSTTKKKKAGPLSSKRSK